MSETSRRISLARCSRYDVSDILAAMTMCLADISFDLGSVAGKTVLLKPNMLGAYPPHKHVTTHPACIEAAAKLFKRAGAHVQVGDSSNGIYPTDEVWNVTGIRRAAELAGAEIVPFERAGSVQCGGLRIAAPVFDADIVVNLPKFKTHGLTALTVATKNLFGCVPGMMKTELHRRNIRRADFAKVLVDIAEIVRPGLTIVDAVTGMDGDGPSAGRLVEMGLVIAGDDVHALDAACCMLIGIDPLELDTLSEAHIRGLLTDPSSIDIRGLSLNDARPARFELPSSFVKRRVDWAVARAVLKLIWNNVRVQPRIEPDRCQRCGLCIESCPVEAIGWEGKQHGDAPTIDKDMCVQCFCCHEICPYAAIVLDRSWLVRLAQRLGRYRTRLDRSR